MPNDHSIKLSGIVQNMSREDLANFVSKIAEENPAIADRLFLEATGNIATDVLVSIVRDAIKAATFVPEHLINRDFPYDSAAYERAAEGLEKLIARLCVEEAMQLGLELMRAGSNQIVNSDTGDMLEEVARCLRIVHAGLISAGVDIATLIQWKKKLAQADQTGFVMDEIAG